jgi:hypothetical protein
MDSEQRKKNTPEFLERQSISIELIEKSLHANQLEPMAVNANIGPKSCFAS